MVYRVKLLMVKLLMFALDGHIPAELYSAKGHSHIDTVNSNCVIISHCEIDQYTNSSLRDPANGSTLFADVKSSGTAQLYHLFLKVHASLNYGARHKRENANS